MTFLRYYLHFENPEISAKFVKELTVLTERSTTMGIEELLLDQAKKEGKKEGMEKGMEKGIVQGMEKGIKATALKMKNSGLDANLIANITGLSVEEIEKLS